jgi:hypothetical protein
MTLSIKKLEQLLNTKGYILHKYLTVDKYCTYIHIVSTTDDINFLLYIPSKYEFKMETSRNVYALEDIDLKSSKTTTEEYTGSPDETKLENEYEEIDLETKLGKDINISDRLEDGYKRDISLNDISKEDTKDINDIYRQLTRLGYCVKNIKYKLGIMYKNYICVIRRDDTLDCYYIKNWNKKNSRQLFIIVDLETLFEQLDTVKDNIQTVLQGIYKVLNKNQNSHQKTLRKFLDEKTDIILSTEIAQHKTEEYTNYINELEIILKSICESEKTNKINIKNIHEKYNNLSNKSLQTDIEKSHLIAAHEKTLEITLQNKKDTMSIIKEIRTKRDDNLLNIDKILFDNQVMLHEIIKNFESLTKI